ncbi:hypothetical protein B0H11DRAFT_2203663 [Mycena galericulata]|nr:hypothetical protein B0H11DRAFT_2203663 [Mycena galericulata]
MDSHNADPPFLLPELEREIFELSAHLHPGSAPKLLLVAHRVLTWIEPLIYRVISIEEDSAHILHALRLKPTQFVNDNVQHLFVASVDDDEIEEILSACTRIRSLVLLASSPSVLSAVLRLRPQKLAIDLDSLFGGTDLVDFSLPLFTAITHLDLFDIPSEFIGPWPNLALLPALTHLALMAYTPAAVMMQVLRNCSRVEVLVSMHTRSESFEGLPFAEDVRFVSMCLSKLQYKLDWKSGANGGMDFWGLGYFAASAAYAPRHRRVSRGHRRVLHTTAASFHTIAASFHMTAASHLTTTAFSNFNAAHHRCHQQTRPVYTPCYITSSITTLAIMFGRCTARCLQLSLGVAAPSSTPAVELSSITTLCPQQ